MILKDTFIVLSLTPKPNIDKKGNFAHSKIITNKNKLFLNLPKIKVKIYTVRHTLLNILNLFDNLNRVEL